VVDKASGARTFVFKTAGYDADQRPTRTVVTDYGDFLNGPTINDRKREIAALLGNLTQETSGMTGAERVNYGLYFNEELGLEGTALTWYTTNPANPEHAYLHEFWPPEANRGYHGRGPIQLSWNYNYGLFSAIYFGDKNVLLRNPERVVQDGVLAFATAIWFWMTPQSPKPSCHTVLLSDWAGLGTWTWGFGATIMVINGFHEQNKDESDPRIATRVAMYRKLAERNGADISGERLTTLGMVPLSDF